jgi:hypothetical protein
MSEVDKKSNVRESSQKSFDWNKQTRAMAHISVDSSTRNRNVRSVKEEGFGIKMRPCMLKKINPFATRIQQHPEESVHATTIKQSICLGWTVD